MTNPNTLQALAESLSAKYPDLTFEVVDGMEVGGVIDAPVIAFTIDEVCIIDPLSAPDGRFEADPMSIYGISLEDAQAIHRANFPE